jgi:hypothetical protein
MKKFLSLMLLAATPLMGSLDYGYFYVNNAQSIGGPTAGGLYSGVIWDQSNDEHSHDIHINSNNLDEIVIEDRGTYVAHFTTFGTPSTEGQTSYRFGLELNGELVPGSIFAVTANADDPIEELVGQVVFRVTEKDSVIRLVNDSADNANVTLANIAGHSGAANNVTASLYIEQIRKHRD